MPVFSRIAVLLVLTAPLVAIASDAAEDPVPCTANERATYEFRVRQALMAAWEVPNPDRSIGCTVIIAQNFRGEVLDAGVESCPDDPLVRKSVTDAAYEASPLPRAENRACQERVLRLRLVYRAQPAS